jgi:hypothetical protein
MKVELLWWEGCPSYPETLADLERVLDEEDIEAEVDMVEVASDEQARRERFPGSPTIRIGGEDILPPDEQESFSLTCRVYRLRDGRPSPTPDREDLREAIRRRAHPAEPGACARQRRAR